METGRGLELDLLKTAFLALLVTFPGLCAPREYEIKAAFIYNFLRYIEWPNPRAGLTVGILGEEPFEGGLEQFQQKPLAGKSITVKSLKSGKDARSCDVVFISASEAGQVDNLLGNLKGAPVLTISDLPSFVEKGGQIGFTTERNRVRFIVNTDALTQSELKASSNLLKLAIVKGG